MTHDKTAILVGLVAMVIALFVAVAFSTPFGATFFVGELVGMVCVAYAISSAKKVKAPTT